MNNQDFLIELVQKKIDRQARLRSLKRDLENLDENLHSSKFKKFIGLSYWLLKRWVTLLVGLGLIVFGLTFIFFPDSISKKGERFYDLHYTSFEGQAVVLLSVDFDKYSDEIKELDVNSSTTEKLQLLRKWCSNYLDMRVYYQMIKYGIALILLALIVLYLSRQIRMVKLRNSKLDEAEKLTREMAQSFQQVIEEEESELERLKEIIGQY